MSEGGLDTGRALLGQWAIVDKLLRDAEELPGFDQEYRGQAELLYHLGTPLQGFWQLNQAHQVDALHRLMNLVPRLRVPEAMVTLQRILRLWHGPNPREAIGRAVRVTSYDPRPLHPGEEIYQVGGFCEQMVNWTRESDSPADFLFGGALIAIAAACGYNVHIDRNVDTIHLGTHYAIFTGKKGSFKSVGLDAAKDLIQRLNYLVDPWDVTKDLPRRNPHPYTVRFLPEDTNWRTIVGCLKATPVMATPLAEHGIELTATLLQQLGVNGGQFFPPDQGVLLLDEAATIFGKQNFAVDRIVPGLNATHRGTEYVYETQSGGRIVLEKPSIVFAGCCPPDILQTALTPTVFAGGFLDRVNIVHAEPLPGPGLFSTPRPRDPTVAVGLAEQLLHIRKLSLLSYELIARPDAAVFFDEWFHSLTEAEDPREYSIARRANHLWRYAAYIALGNGREPWISLRDFEHAVRIQNRELEGYRRLLAQLETDPGAELMNYIERQLYRHDAIAPDGWMTRSALFLIIRDRKGLNPPTVKAIPYLDSLEQSGRITQRVKGAHRYFQLTVEAAQSFGKGG